MSKKTYSCRYTWITRLNIHGFFHPARGMQICVFLFILLSGEEIFGCAFVYFII